MLEAKFSYKEAITHGWEMTRKYWKTILVFAVIYISFHVISGVPGFFAGSSHIAQAEVRKAFKDGLSGDRFYKHLIEVGYINKYGSVEDKLQQVSAAADLTLPSDLENKRTDIYNFLNHYRYRLPFPKVIYYILAVIFWLIGMVLSIGYIKVTLMMARDQKPAVAELFSNWSLLIPYLLGSFCCGLAVMGGILLLIVPGIIFMLMFQMFPYLIVDRGLGPIEALKRSRVITKGSRGRLAVFGLLLILLNIGGFLCLVVGLFLTTSISGIAAAYVYDRLETADDADGQNAEMATLKRE